MSTKMFCDLCGDESPVVPTALMENSKNSATIFKNLGDTCDHCRTGAIVALESWRDEKIKSKKTMQIVDAKAVVNPQAPVVAEPVVPAPVVVP